MTLTDVSIVPLTPDRLADLATLFDQGGDPRWCWCAYFRVRGTDFSAGSQARHRSVLQAATTDGLATGHAPGLIAYDGGTVVGWISLGPRDDYERLAHSKVLAPIDAMPVWSIVCFVVGRQARGRGIARTLLEAGIAYAREHGAVMLEAYPVEVPEGERVPPGTAFKGTLGMYERAGFRLVARRQWNASTPVRPIVRLDLGGTATT